eukprot:gene53773-71862_t
MERAMDGLDGEIDCVDEAGLARLVDRFYAAVRADDMIGPLFNDAIHDWPDHLGKLAAFWSSLMLGSGRYKGMPMAAHLRHRDRITPAMFDRWLSLWREATEAEMPPAVAVSMQAKAGRIAENFKLALGSRIPEVDLGMHHKAHGFGDRLAYGFTKTLRFCADTFFAKRYGHRAIVLETVAAVPGMVGATLTHLRCLRNMCDDQGWIRTLMEEAENERMHLRTFIEVAKPTLFV